MEEETGSLKWDRVLSLLSSSAVGLHFIDGPEDILARMANTNSLRLGFAGAENTDHFPILVQDRPAAIARIGRNSDLAGEGIPFKTCLGAHVSLPIHDLIAGIAQREDLFGQVGDALADAIGKLLEPEGLKSESSILRKARSAKGSRWMIRALYSPLLFCTSTRVAFLTTWALVTSHPLASMRKPVPPEVKWASSGKALP